MTPYIISGLVVGSIYAISALGLVLTYTSSRVFNFAHGAIAYAIAVFYYYLTRQNGWSIATAAPFTILIVAPLLGPAALLRALQAAHARHARRCGWCRPSALGRASPRSSEILFPFASDARSSTPRASCRARPTPNFLKVFGTYVNENQFVVIVERGGHRDRRDARAALHARSGWRRA